MSGIEEPIVSNDLGYSFRVGELRYSPKAYRCHLAILPDEEGGFSVLVLNLPGTGSCGKTEAEAIAHAKEAVLAVIESYEEDKTVVPWIDEYKIPATAKLVWILVHGE